ncbi:hypothetical protein E4U22_000917, partial [Claviceps purpurea]
MLEGVRLSYLAVIRSGFNPVEIFVRSKLHNTTFDRRRGEPTDSSTVEAQSVQGPLATEFRINIGRPKDLSRDNVF